MNRLMTIHLFQKKEMYGVSFKGGTARGRRKSLDET
jgi:hypothetical protein